MIQNPGNYAAALRLVPPGGGVTSIIAGTGISVDQATGDVTVTATGGSGLWTAPGTQNLFGPDAGNDTLTGDSNICAGWQAGIALTSGSGNIALGSQNLLRLEDGGSNTAIGLNSCGNLVTAYNNAAYGSGTLINLVSGSYNTAIGDAAGQNYLTNESNNICIGNTGVEGDNGVIRVGQDGTHTVSYLAGDVHIGAGNPLSTATFYGYAAALQYIYTSAKTNPVIDVTHQVAQSLDATAVFNWASGFFALYDMATPATPPPAGQVYVYFKSDSPFYMPSDGIERPFGLWSLNLGVAVYDGVAQAKGLNLNQAGADASAGITYLTAGTATVTTTLCDTNSIILLTNNELGTVTEAQRYWAVKDPLGGAFDIVSSDPTDTSAIGWILINPPV